MKLEMVSVPLSPPLPNLRSSWLQLTSPANALQIKNRLHLPRLPSRFRSLHLEQMDNKLHNRFWGDAAADIVDVPHLTLNEGLRNTGGLKKSPRENWGTFLNKSNQIDPQDVSGLEDGEQEYAKDDEDVEGKEPRVFETQDENDVETQGKGGARSGFWKGFARRLSKASPFVPASKRSEEVRFIQEGGANLEIRWRDLIDPTPENLLALLLTALLSLAILQICWQLFLVAAVIALTALKYSILAAILIALLVALL